MKIYIDVLVITNAVITLFYIRCIERIMKENASAKREAAGACIGGLGSLIAAVQAKSFLEALFVTFGKLLMISFIIITVFRFRGFANFTKHLFLYGLCEIIMGGACFAFVSFSHSKMLCIKNYTVYFDISLLQLGLCCAFVYLLISAYETVQRKRSQTVRRCRLTFKLGRFEKTLPAIEDTGNKLCDSFTGLPVVIIKCDELFERYSIDRPEQTLNYGFHPVPYETINGSGLIFVTNKGDVTIDYKDEKINALCCVGILPSYQKKGYAVFNPESI